VCPSCSNNNFAWRGECNKCGKAKPEGAAVVGPQISQQPNVPVKPGDWACGGWTLACPGFRYIYMSGFLRRERADAGHASLHF
jgi:hypothetical protein